jgi:cytochrome P450
LSVAARESEEFEFDPFDDKYWGDPYPYYRVMRRRYPAYRREIENHRIWPHYWMLSRAEDVNAAAADWKRFSSARGTLVDTDASLLPPNMFNMDPPRHDVHRRILSRVLTPSRVAALEPFVDAHARGLIDAFKAKGSADVVTEFSQLIPSTVVCELMGLPKEDQLKFLDWNLATLGGADFTSEAALRAYGEMEQYWKQLVATRRSTRTDDLVSQILSAVAEERADLSEAEVWGFCSLLHDASQNTTINMITNGLIALARHPDERRKLAEHPELWPTGIDELLRYVSPVQGLARTVTTDVQIDDVTIPAGDQVLLLYGSANHDDTVYDAPDALDVTREAKAQWTFGHGIHFCLGAAVAKLETRVALKCFVEVIGEWDVDDDAVVRSQLVPTRGITSAPVRFAAAEG